MIDLLNKTLDLTPKPKTGGAARRKVELPQKRNKTLYNPCRVIYHPQQENA